MIEEISYIFEFILSSIYDFFFYFVESNWFYVVMPLICSFACFLIFEILRIIIKQVYK